MNGNLLREFQSDDESLTSTSTSNWKLDIHRNLQKILSKEVFSSETFERTELILKKHLFFDGIFLIDKRKYFHWVNDEELLFVYWQHLFSVNYILISEQIMMRMGILLCNDFSSINFSSFCSMLILDFFILKKKTLLVAFFFFFSIQKGKMCEICFSVITMEMRHEERFKWPLR